MEMTGQLYSPAALCVGKRNLKWGGWVELRDSPDISEKVKASFPSQILNNDFLVIQPVV